jgi:L-rhamnose mutarotase
MKRRAFMMKLHPGVEEEYEKRHDEIWPELAEEIRSTGIRNYNIFFDLKTSILYASYEYDNEEKADALAQMPITRKWWNFMADIMEVNPDNSPVCLPLKQVFHMD